MTQQLSRADAVRTARITRAAVVVLAAGGVALAVVGLPERQIPAAGIPTAAPATPGGQTGADTGSSTRAAVPQRRFDAAEAAAVAARLAVLDNAPKIQRPAGIAVVDEPVPGLNETPEDLGATAIADRVRYLGMVQSGRNRAALMRVDGRQRIVREGATLGPPSENPSLPVLTVERITGANALIADGRTRTPVPLQARSGPSITMAGGGTVVEQVEIPQPEDEQSAIAGQRELPQRERDRRARSIERQRNGTLNTGPEGALRPPENMRTFGVNERRSRDAAREQSGD